MFVKIKHDYEYVLSQFELVLNRSDCWTQRLCPYLLRSNDKAITIHSLHSVMFYVRWVCFLISDRVTVQNRTTVDKNKPESADLFVYDKLIIAWTIEILIWERLFYTPMFFEPSYKWIFITFF